MNHPLPEQSDISEIKSLLKENWEQNNQILQQQDLIITTIKNQTGYQVERSDISFYQQVGNKIKFACHVACKYITVHTVIGFIYIGISGDDSFPDPNELAIKVRTVVFDNLDVLNFNTRLNLPADQDSDQENHYFHLKYGVPTTTAPPEPSPSMV
ncbi:hypothetical protein [Gimesia sp.]|uniref:hypothetical protein n=1 Tax=Gimesia sp. TaxID=2024833 RepID=UPI0032ED1043